MIYKYFVPKTERKQYNKRILYCKVLDKIKLATAKNDFIYKVQILNCNKRIGIFNSNELKKLNIIEKIFWR